MRRRCGAKYRLAMSRGFEFERDLQRVGVANQTTMLSGESLAIANQVRESMIRRYGAAQLPERFRTFDTICSATQERQDAVIKLLEAKPDLMLVVGGYNSSNTTHLAALARERGVRAYHIEDAAAVDVATGTLRHQPSIKAAEETVARLVDRGPIDRHHRRGVNAQQQDRRNGAPGLRRSRCGARPAVLSVAATPRFPVSPPHRSWRSSCGRPVSAASPRGPDPAPWEPRT